MYHIATVRFLDIFRTTSGLHDLDKLGYKIALFRLSPGFPIACSTVKHTASEGKLGQPGCGHETRLAVLHTCLHTCWWCRIMIGVLIEILE